MKVIEALELPRNRKFSHIGQQYASCQIDSGLNVIKQLNDIKTGKKGKHQFVVMEIVDTFDKDHPGQYVMDLKFVTIEDIELWVVPKHVEEFMLDYKAAMEK